jgi:hypothetical protein
MRTGNMVIWMRKNLESLLTKKVTRDSVLKTASFIISIKIDGALLVSLRLLYLEWINVFRCTDETFVIAAGSWVVSMAGALTYSFSNKYLSTQQKLVQARMYAQAVTIAVLMASASLSVYAKDDEKEQKDEPDAQLRAVLELPHKEKSKQQ